MLCTCTFGFGLLILISFAGATAAKADVMYDYSGNVLDTTNDYPAGHSISGDFVLANPLPASAETDNSVFQSFEFTDGINTITNNTPNVSVGLAAGGHNTFITNSSGQIADGEITVVVHNPSPPPGGNVSLSMDISSVGDSSSFTTLTTGGACCLSGEATSRSPGAWSGPLAVGTPPPTILVTAALKDVIMREIHQQGQDRRVTTDRCCPRLWENAWDEAADALQLRQQYAINVIIYYNRRREVCLIFRAIIRTRVFQQYPRLVRSAAGGVDLAG
jgi:hypothetical protein